MRLDARKGDFPWTVWECERAELLHTCVWVDDVTAEYGMYVTNGAGKIVLIANDVMITTIQARKIEIHPDIRTVLINPLEDFDGAGLLIDNELVVVR